MDEPLPSVEPAECVQPYISPSPPSTSSGVLPRRGRVQDEVLRPCGTDTPCYLDLDKVDMRPFLRMAGNHFMLAYVLKLLPQDWSDLDHTPPRTAAARFRTDEWFHDFLVRENKIYRALDLFRAPEKRDDWRLAPIGHTKRCIVWSAPGSEEFLWQTCIKVLLWGDFSSLFMERAAWTHIYTAIREQPTFDDILLVPKCHGLINPHLTDPVSIDNMKAPYGVNEHGAIICERIRSLPQIFIDRIFSHEDTAAAHVMDINIQRSHCLVRPLLGCATAPPIARHALAQDVLLGEVELSRALFNTSGTALAMGKGLAFLHWIVGADGAGVHFVYGRERKRLEDAPDNCALWMLSFRECRRVSGSSEEVYDQMAAAILCGAPV